MPPAGNCVTRTFSYSDRPLLRGCDAAACTKVSGPCADLAISGASVDLWHDELLLPWLSLSSHCILLGRPLVSMTRLSVSPLQVPDPLQSHDAESETSGEGEGLLFSISSQDSGADAVLLLPWSQPPTPSTAGLHPFFQACRNSEELLQHR